MDDSELSKLADALDASTDGADVQACLSQAEPFVWLTANQAGCLRFAAAFLRAAASPVTDGDGRARAISVEIDGECRSTPILVDHVQIPEEKKDYTIRCVIQRAEMPREAPESIKGRKRRGGLLDRLGLIGCGLVAFVVAFLLASGVGFWWSLFTKRG